MAVWACPGLRIENNIFYQWAGPKKPNWAVVVYAGKDGKFDLRSDYNLFYSPMDYHKIGALRTTKYDIISEGHTLAQWQENSGHDQHSIQADPMFVDVDQGDFRLRPGSPAIGGGRDGVTIGACGTAANR